MLILNLMCIKNTFSFHRKHKT